MRTLRAGIVRTQAVNQRPKLGRLQLLLLLKQCKSFMHQHGEQLHGVRPVLAQGKGPKLKLNAFDGPAPHQAHRATEDVALKALGIHLEKVNGLVTVIVQAAQGDACIRGHGRANASTDAVHRGGGLLGGIENPGVARVCVFRDQDGPTGGRVRQADLHKEFITPDNIVSLFDKYRVPLEPDYVSIDVDAIDLWLFKALIEGGYRPRVVSVEYNVNMPIDAVLVQALDAGNEFDYAFGASLRAVATVAEELGYVVVHIVQGLDVMLVRADLMRGVDIRPLEDWAACCTNHTLHAIPSPQRVEGLMDYNMFRKTGDEGAAKAAARQYLAERPYLMTRPTVPFAFDLSNSK